MFKVRVKGLVKGLDVIFPTGAEWSIMLLGFAKYSKKSKEIQTRHTLKNVIQCSSQALIELPRLFNVHVTYQSDH